MKLVTTSLEHMFYEDMITNNGFIIEQEDPYAPINVDQLINTSQYMETEYRCDCGAFIGRDIIGKVCPKCNSEITLRSLNFKYTGWMDIKEHKLLTPHYYNKIKRMIGPNMLKYILGDYKADIINHYSENDNGFYEKKKAKKIGRIVNRDLVSIEAKIPKSKHCFRGIGHDAFYRDFETVMRACAPKSAEGLDELIADKYKAFTSKIPIYSTAYRPVSKTSETMFYPDETKNFSQMASVYCKLPLLQESFEYISALNSFQQYWNEAVTHLVKDKLGGKDGDIRSEIVGGTFSFSSRGVISLGPSLRSDEVDLPLPMCITVYKYMITHRLAKKYNLTLEMAYNYTNEYYKYPQVIEILQEIIAEEQWLYMVREPANNFASIWLFKIRNVKFNDDTISIPNESLEGFNADFDGDALNCKFIPKELVPFYLHYKNSGLINHITGDVNIPLKEWFDISLGRLTE